MQSFLKLEVLPAAAPTGIDTLYGDLVPISEPFAVITSIEVRGRLAVITDLGYNPHVKLIDIGADRTLAKFASSFGSVAFSDPLVVELAVGRNQVATTVWDTRRNVLAEFHWSESGDEALLVWTKKYSLPQQMTRRSSLP